VIIMSYDSLRADADALLAGRAWSYCILDEGHAIRNPKARITQVGRCRLTLSDPR